MSSIIIIVAAHDRARHLLPLPEIQKKIPKIPNFFWGLVKVQRMHFFVDIDVYALVLTDKIVLELKKETYFLI